MTQGETVPGIGSGFDPAVDMGTPKTLDDAMRERNAWVDTAMQHSRNEDYYRGQRDAFLRAALTDPAVAAVAERICGEGWRRPIDDESGPERSCVHPPGCTWCSWCGFRLAGDETEARAADAREET